MEKIIRTSILIGLLTAILFAGRSKWIEFGDRPAAERYSHPSYKKAVNYYRKTLELVPLAASHYALAESYVDEGLDDQAAEEYKKTLQMDKRSVRAYLGLANVYLRRGSYKEAFELLEEAEAVAPENLDIKDLKQQVSYDYFLEAGVKTFEKGDRIQAREFLSKALEMKPDSAYMHYLIALTFDEQQDFYRAEDYLKKAISLDAKFFLAHSFLGDIYFRKGDFEAAVKQYQASLAAHPDDPSVRKSLELASTNLNQPGSVVSSVEGILVFDPANKKRNGDF